MGTNGPRGKMDEGMNDNSGWMEWMTERTMMDVWNGRQQVQQEAETITTRTKERDRNPIIDTVAPALDWRRPSP